MLAVAQRILKNIARRLRVAWRLSREA